MAKKYEYKLLKSNRETTPNIEDDLNKLGKEGWYVVTFREHTAAGYDVWLVREV